MRTLFFTRTPTTRPSGEPWMRLSPFAEFVVFACVLCSVHPFEVLDPVIVSSAVDMVNELLSVQ